MKRLISILMLLASPAWGQYGGYNRPRASQTASVVMSVDFTTDASSTGIVVAPQRKQLGNFGTGCTSGVIQPTGSGDQVGQLYATTAIKTAAESAGCATQGVPTATSSGINIDAPDNGHGAGGDASATAFTDTYNGTADDAICTGDSHHNDPTLFPASRPPDATRTRAAISR